MSVQWETNEKQVERELHIDPDFDVDQQANWQNLNTPYRRDYCREEFGVFVGLSNVTKFYLALAGMGLVIYGIVRAIRAAGEWWQR